MIFVVRTTNTPPAERIVRIRTTPALVATAADQRDVFCVGDETVSDRLRAQGWNVLPLHDGWYTDDDGGGVAVWGNGRYWEVRSTPFDVIAHD